MEAGTVKEGTALIAFTAQGMTVAERLCPALNGVLRERSNTEQTLFSWTEENFVKREALIFVGAVGIAVRAIAPYLKNKADDPAVVCVDEMGRWVIPILSGHLGGANELARRIAEITGGEAVITTATDLNGAFAVDLWAKAQKLLVLQPERIRRVSSRILCGECISVVCPWTIKGRPPERISQLRNPEKTGDVLVSWRRTETEALQLVPRVLSLGVGCRRGTDCETLKTVFARFCEERGILPQAVEQAASIDVKQDEAGLIRFCTEMGWLLQVYSAAELQNVKGAFSGSAFVESAVGVDNVCERAAVLASGGELTERKYATDGVTFALAERPVCFDWRT
jgi:cobalt-precorrin 5A hydrolase